MMLGFSTNAFYHYLEDKLSIKMNGFTQAREAMKVARVNAPREPKTQAAWRRSIGNWWRSLVFAKVEVKGYAHTLVGPIGIVWLWLKAMKQRACPILYFVDPEDVKRQD
jgi:hypothetical protein